MAVSLSSKKRSVIRSTLLVLAVAAVFFASAQLAGETADTVYFSGKQQWAANTVFDLPVQIIPLVPTAKSSSPKSSCEAQPTLCEKIKFSWKFSESEKRRYQKLVMLQVLSIDKLLSTSRRLQDELFSITLTKETGDRRAWAGSSTVLIHLGAIRSQNEFVEVLTHELGHIVDLKLLTKNTWRKGVLSYSFDDPSLDFYAISWESQTTRKADAGYLSFVGGYAMSDPFEDFAESFNLYLNHAAVFKLLAAHNKNLQKKYDYMDKLFGKKYLKSDGDRALTMENDLKVRVWDTTKDY